MKLANIRLRDAIHVGGRLLNVTYLKDDMFDLDLSNNVVTIRYKDLEPIVACIHTASNSVSWVPQVIEK